MIKIQLISKEDCPKCDYVKKIFKEGIEFDEDFVFEEINYSKIESEFFTKNTLQYVPILRIWNNAGKETIISSGMTRENIKRVVNNHIKI